MTLNNHKTLYTAHFSHGTVHCVLGLSLHNPETARKHVFVNLAIGTCWQKNYFPTVKPGQFSLKSAQNAHSFIFFFIKTTALVKLLNILKATGCLPLLLRSHLTVQFHLIRVTTHMAINSQRILSPDIFYHAMIHCFLGVLLHNSETARKYAFVNLGIES